MTYEFKPGDWVSLLSKSVNFGGYICEIDAEAKTAWVDDLQDEPIEVPFHLLKLEQTAEEYEAECAEDLAVREAVEALAAGGDRPAYTPGVGDLVLFRPIDGPCYTSWGHGTVTAVDAARGAAYIHGRDRDGKPKTFEVPMADLRLATPAAQWGEKMREAIARATA